MSHLLLKCCERTVSHLCNREKLSQKVHTHRNEWDRPSMTQYAVCSGDLESAKTTPGLAVSAQNVMFDALKLPVVRTRHASFAKILGYLQKTTAFPSLCLTPFFSFQAKGCFMRVFLILGSRERTN